jgi:hypothetical protein
VVLSSLFLTLTGGFASKPLENLQSRRLYSLPGLESGSEVNEPLVSLYAW